MDTTTEATPLVRAWELLADLAACGQDSTAIRDAQELAQPYRRSVARRLPCPWGLILLQTVADPAASARWGLDDERTQRLLKRNGHGLPADAIEIPLQHAGAPAGMLLLGITPSTEAILTPSFLQALRSQIELLISVAPARNRTPARAGHARCGIGAALRSDWADRSARGGAYVDRARDRAQRRAERRDLYRDRRWRCGADGRPWTRSTITAAFGLIAARAWRQVVEQRATLIVDNYQPI